MIEAGKNSQARFDEYTTRQQKRIISRRSTIRLLTVDTHSMGWKQEGIARLDENTARQ
jgi:hypothetical protein